MNYYNINESEHSIAVQKKKRQNCRFYLRKYSLLFYCVFRICITQKWRVHHNGVVLDYEFFS